MSLQEEIDKKLDEWEGKVNRKLIKPDAQPVEDTTRSRIMAAGLGAISGLAVSTLGPMLFRRKITPVWKRIPVKPAASITLAGGVAGLTAPSLVNTIIAERRGEISAGTAEKELKERQDIEKDLDTAIAAIPTFRKQAGLLTTPLKAGGKALGWMAGGVGTGLKTPWWSRKAKIGIPARAWGLATHGAAGFGVYKGIKAIRDRRQLSGTNYATMLRNNLLAGNVKMDELSQADLLAVRRLGMR